MTAAITTDSLFNGRLKVNQRQHGYRFSLDAVLLAYHAGLREAETVVDLGAGCGVISLIMAFRNPDLRLVGVEIQRPLFELALANVAANQLTHRIQIRHQDLKHTTLADLGGPVDMVVSNPPYRRAQSGRINPNPEKALARHEIAASLSDVLAAAQRLLKPTGRLLLIYPAERCPDLICQMRDHGLEPKYLRSIHSRLNAPAELVVAEGVNHGRPGIKIASPLIIYQEHGIYTPETAQIYESFTIAELYQKPRRKEKHGRFNSTSGD